MSVTPGAVASPPRQCIGTALASHRGQHRLHTIETGMNQMTTPAWQATTLVKCISVRPWLRVPGNDEPGGCDDLTLGKLYECLGTEADGAFVRIIDDSDDDFLYPASHFREV